MLKVVAFGIFLGSKILIFRFNGPSTVPSEMPFVPEADFSMGTRRVRRALFEFDGILQRHFYFHVSGQKL